MSTDFVSEKLFKLKHLFYLWKHFFNFILISQTSTSDILRTTKAFDVIFFASIQKFIQYFEPNFLSSLEDSHFFPISSCLASVVGRLRTAGRLRTRHGYLFNLFKFWLTEVQWQFSYFLKVVDQFRHPPNQFVCFCI